MRAELEDIFELAVRAASHGLRVAVPARVVRVEHAAGRVAVKPQLLRPRADPELPPDEDGVVADVPVAFSSSSTVEVSHEISAGDAGLLVFCDFSLARWLGSGEVGAPGPGGAHGLSGAVFLPGLAPDGEQVPIPETGVLVGYRSGERLEVVPGEVRAGAGATDLGIKASYLTSESTYLTAQATYLTAQSAYLSAFILWIDEGGFVNGPATTAFKAAIGVFNTAVGAFNTARGVFQSGLSGHQTSVTRVK